MMASDFIGPIWRPWLSGRPPWPSPGRANRRVEDGSMYSLVMWVYDQLAEFHWEHGQRNPWPNDHLLTAAEKSGLEADFEAGAWVHTTARLRSGDCSRRFLEVVAELIAANAFHGPTKTFPRSAFRDEEMHWLVTGILARDYPQMIEVGKGNEFRTVAKIVASILLDPDNTKSMSQMYEDNHSRLSQNLDWLHDRSKSRSVAIQRILFHVWNDAVEK